jgi:hypothetical protein
VGTSCPGTTSATPITVLFATNVVTLNVSDNYVLDVHSTTTTSLTDFADTFGEEELAPEPSTFILFGSALVGIVALRIRKRKQQA